MEYLVSIFTVGSVVGYGVETLWCVATRHVFESRQGMVFGPFSQVYGLGAVLLTLAISRDSSKAKVFVISAILGGIYEYFCSYVQERMFGTISWDYGKGPLSIGGRTSLVFCVFWGIMGVALIKYVNPAISFVLSKLNGNGATILSAVAAVFFILNLRLSYMAVKRQCDRQRDIPPATEVEEWLDTSFNDDVLRKIYPNMRHV